MAYLRRMPLSQDLLDILVCSESKKPLIYFPDESFLFCPDSRLKYRIEEGIPNMLLDDAERVDEAEAKRLIADAKQRGLA